MGDEAFAMVQNCNKILRMACSILLEVIITLLESAIVEIEWKAVGYEDSSEWEHGSFSIKQHSLAFVEVNWKLIYESFKIL